MTTSFFHSLSFDDCRISQACLYWHSDHLQKSIMFFSDCVQQQKCYIKLYMIPTRAFTYHHGLRPFVLLGSLEENVTCQKNHVFSGASLPNKLQRSKKSLGCSQNPYAGLKDLERQLEELFNEVKAMIKMGNKRDATDLLQANYEAVKERMNAGARGVEEAASLDVIALGYMAIGDLKFVGYPLDLLNEVVGSLEDNEPLLDLILIHMGNMYSALEKFEKSMIIYRRAISILESMYGKDSTFLITPLLGMAKVLCSIGRGTKAIETYHHAISILESSRGSESGDLVAPLIGLGNLLIKEGRAKEAEAPFIRILNIYKNLYGENDGRVGMAMSSLALVKCATGNAEEAVDLYKNALQIIKDTSYMSLDDSVMEKMRIDLAELLHVVGRAQEGRELLEECLLITEKYKGKDHPNSVTHLINLAISYSRSKNFVEAERLLRTSLEIMRKTVEPEDQSLTFPMLHLAITLYHLRRFKEAEQLALDVLHIREKAFGKDSLPVGEALDCLVSIQTNLRRDENLLLDRLKRVLSIQERELGYESEEVMLTLKKILFYLDKLGKKDEKFPLQKRLSQLRIKNNPTV